jgi:outer membrane beta-barrel protein
VREPDRREVKVNDIDSENFEIGGYAGILDVQDFGSNAVYGVRAAYHITEDFFLEGVYGRSELGKTSFEKLSGNVELLSNDDRQFSYYNLSVGYNVLPGEAFVGRKYAFRGGLYLVAGAGSSDFAGDQRFTISGGFGYRVAATDWMSLRIDVRDYVFQSDLLGSNETLNNLEFTGGMTIFF